MKDGLHAIPVTQGELHHREIISSSWNKLHYYYSAPFSPCSQELSHGCDCQWRYYNYSILNSQPHPSGESVLFHLALTFLFPCQSDHQTANICPPDSSAENGRLLLQPQLLGRRRGLIILGRAGRINVQQSSSRGQPSGDRYTLAVITSPYDKLN